MGYVVDADRPLHRGARDTDPSGDNGVVRFTAPLCSALDAPNGVSAGGTPWIRLSLSNESQTGDALVGVTSPDVRQASPHMAGNPSGRSTFQPVRMWIWNGKVQASKLTDFRRDIKAGQTWFPITLTFANSAPITMTITAGPLANKTPSGM